MAKKGSELAKLSWPPTGGQDFQRPSNPRHPRVVDGVLRVAVAKVVLDEPDVVALVRQVEAA